MQSPPRRRTPRRACTQKPKSTGDQSVWTTYVESKRMQGLKPRVPKSLRKTYGISDTESSSAVESEPLQKRPRARAAKLDTESDETNSLAAANTASNDEQEQDNNGNDDDEQQEDQNQTMSDDTDVHSMPELMNYEPLIPASEDTRGLDKSADKTSGVQVKDMSILTAMAMNKATTNFNAMTPDGKIEVLQQALLQQHSTVRDVEEKNETLAAWNAQLLSIIHHPEYDRPKVGPGVEMNRADLEQVPLRRSTTKAERRALLERREREKKQEDENATEQEKVAQNKDQDATDDTDKATTEMEQGSTDATNKPAGDDTDKATTEMEQGSTDDTCKPAGDDTDKAATEMEQSSTDDTCKPAGDDTDKAATEMEQSSTDDTCKSAATEMEQSTTDEQPTSDKEEDATDDTDKAATEPDKEGMDTEDAADAGDSESKTQSEEDEAASGDDNVASEENESAATSEDDTSESESSVEAMDASQESAAESEDISHLPSRVLVDVMGSDVSDYGGANDSDSMASMIDDKTKDNDLCDRKAKEKIGIPEYAQLGRYASAPIGGRPRSTLPTEIMKTMDKIETMYQMSSKRKAFND